MANYNVAVKEWEGQLIFLRRLVEGGVSRSYGIQVARLAGLPDSVIERAWEVLANLEAEELDEIGRPRLSVSERVPAELPLRQLDLFSVPVNRAQQRLVTELAGQDLETLTPVEALVRLEQLRRRARDLLAPVEDR